MFISYAQNFEDVILWRALGHVENGVYIDIGAQDPVIDSVSRAFYEHGWRGIHAEATSYYADKVRQDRPDEIVVQGAIGVGYGSIRFFEFPETGLSTSDEDIAAEHNAAGHRMIETEVPLIPLSSLFEQAGERDVHWLKVDVEGMEASVIESWMPSAVRPWIVAIESTLPNSQEPAFTSWEPTLLSLGYQFVYFDGLSRFYVSEKHPELTRFFGPGPNVFDEFVLGPQTTYTAGIRSLYANNEQEMLQTITGLRQVEQETRQKIARLDNQLRETVSQNAQQLQEIQRKQQALEEALSNSRHTEAAVHEILHHTYQSISWRITRPLRDFNVFLSRLRKIPRGVLRKMLERVIHWLSNNQKWKSRCLYLLHRVPTIRSRLERFAYTRGYGAAPTQIDGEADGEACWYIEAPKGSVAKWHILIKSNSNTR